MADIAVLENQWLPVGTNNATVKAAQFVLRDRHSRMFRPAFFSVYRVGEVRPAWARVRAGLFIDPNVTPLEVSQLLLLVFTDAPVVTSRWNTVSL